MNIWFLRFSLEDPPVSFSQMRKVRLAPILFREIPFRQCSLTLSEEEVRNLVDEHFPGSTPGRKAQFVGALTRFFHDVQVGDLVAICLNRDPKPLFGEVLDGSLREFPGIKDSKARPVRWLSEHEIEKLEVDTLPAQVKKYSGTICFWADANVQDDDEKRKERFYQGAQPRVRQIKFIRVGADFGCGGRLSRLFPNRQYHFIPIPKHNDPEFCRFTYGDVNHALKFRSLLNLRKNDMLVFYEEGARTSRRIVGVFAYFVVREVYLMDRRAKSQTALKLPRGENLIGNFNRSASTDVFAELIAYCGDYNEHAGVEECDSLQLVICGDRKKSRLLRQVEILANANVAGKYILQEKASEKWGLKVGADLTRCSVRTVDAGEVERVSEQLRRLE